MKRRTLIILAVVAIAVAALFAAIVLTHDGRREAFSRGGGMMQGSRDGWGDRMAFAADGRDGRGGPALLPWVLFMTLIGAGVGGGLVLLWRRPVPVAGGADVWRERFDSWHRQAHVQAGEAATAAYPDAAVPAPEAGPAAPAAEASPASPAAEAAPLPGEQAPRAPVGQEDAPKDQEQKPEA